MVPVLEGWEESKMGVEPVKNYCHEVCKYSLLPVDSEGRRLFRNGKLRCALGYTQSVNSVEALANSVLHEARICRILRQKFRAKQVVVEEVKDVKEIGV